MGAEAYQKKKKRIDEAIPSFMFEIQVLRDGYDFSDPKQKQNFSRKQRTSFARLRMCLNEIII